MTDDRPRPSFSPPSLAEKWSQCRNPEHSRDRGRDFAIFAQRRPGDARARRPVAFMNALRHSRRGPRAGQAVRLAPFQRQFVTGALRPGRDGGGSVIRAGQTRRRHSRRASPLGRPWSVVVDRQPAPPRKSSSPARTRRNPGTGLLGLSWSRLSASLRLENPAPGVIFRRAPRLEIESRATAAGTSCGAWHRTARPALGSAPTSASWTSADLAADRGDEPGSRPPCLASANVAAGRFIISNSAPDDAHRRSPTLPLVKSTSLSPVS